MTLQLEHISQRFGSTTALKDINLTIAQGEFVAVLGPSGCGKTTLLRCIGGFIDPTEGIITLDNEVYSSKEIRVPIEDRNLGMVFQSFALWPHMTVREHVEFPLASRRQSHLSPEEKQRLVDKAIADMGLASMEKRLPGQLSGGQRQRVSLARAIVGKPSLLLMDEPLSALDAELRISMRKEIQDIHLHTGATIVYVTHDQGEAMAMADRIIVMRNGEIEQLGTPQEIYYHPATEFVATFVSKCNLLQGNWDGEDFTLTGEEIKYPGKEIAHHFKEKGLYPVRPEQFLLTHEGQGLEVEVTNRQYNGREFQYTVSYKEQDLVVFAGCEERFEPGEKLILSFAEKGRAL